MEQYYKTNANKNKFKTYNSPFAKLEVLLFAVLTGPHSLAHHPSQQWQGHASCLKKTQVVGSLEVPASLDQCSGSPVVGWRVPQTAEQGNEERSSCLQ